MDKSFLEGQKRLLKKEINNLEKELKRIAKKQGSSYSPLYPDYGNQDDENAAEVNQYGAHLGLEKNILTMLNKAKDALKRIEKGNYGICTKCKKAIDRKRLEVVPQADLCLKCASSKK